MSELFWTEIASELEWENLDEADALRYNLDPKDGDVFSEWWSGAKTNLAYNCLETQIEEGRGDDLALIFEANDAINSTTFTFRELLVEVETLAKALKGLGVGKRDVVVMYLPMIPALAISMLACARTVSYTHLTLPTILLV